MITKEQLKCSCGCGKDLIDARLISMLNTLERAIGKPIRIARYGGTRCEYINIMLRANKDSLHLWGKAADIRAKGINTATLAAKARETGFVNVRSCTDFVHVELGGGKN